MKIGEKIQSLRKSSGMSQEVLAQKLNVNRNLLSRVETGKNDPDFSLVVNVSKIFNVDIASLADLDNKSLSYEDKIKEINDQKRESIFGIFNDRLNREKKSITDVIKLLEGDM